MRIVRQLQESAESQLDQELDALHELKVRVAELQEALDKQTQLITQMFVSSGRKSRKVGNYTFTLVQAERTKINEAGLKKALGARNFNKLTVAKLDQMKLRAAIDNGEIDPIVVGQYSEVVLNKPSIRMTEGTNEPED